MFSNLIKFHFLSPLADILNAVKIFQLNSAFFPYWPLFSCFKPKPTQYMIYIDIQNIIIFDIYSEACLDICTGKNTKKILFAVCSFSN